MFQTSKHLALDPEQDQLLKTLVTAQQNLAKSQQVDFSFHEALTRVGGAISRLKVEEVLQSGGTVLYGGEHLYTLDDVPTNWDQDVLLHPGLSHGEMPVQLGDIDALLDQGLLQFRTPDRTQLRITAAGYNYHRQHTEPPEQPDEKFPLPDYEAAGQPWHGPLPPIEEAEDTEAETVAVDVVLLTAVRVEFDAVLRYLQPLPGRNAIVQVVHRKETYYLGTFGKQVAAVTMCRMGYADQGASLAATFKAIETWRPRAVIMVGIAFGKDPDKQKIADVLISSQIICYGAQRVGVGQETIHRGPVVPCGAALLNRFRNVLSWQFARPDGLLCEAKDGPVLSGEVLVDDPAFKANLFARFPQAIGGEMEGTGVYVAGAEHNTEWIIVKAICDWADGKKGKKHHPLAAAAAVSLVHAVLSSPHALADIPKSSRVMTSASTPASDQTPPVGSQSKFSLQAHTVTGVVQADEANVTMHFGDKPADR